MTIKLHTRHSPSPAQRVETATRPLANDVATVLDNLKHRFLDSSEFIVDPLKRVVHKVHEMGIGSMSISRHRLPLTVTIATQHEKLSDFLDSTGMRKHAVGEVAWRAQNYTLGALSGLVALPALPVDVSNKVISRAKSKAKSLGGKLKHIF